MKFKRLIAAVSAVAMSGLCVLSNLYAVSAADSNYATGDLNITASEKQAFYSQFDESDSSIDLSQITYVPASCDLSTSSYFPPIGSQGSIGSCTAWATTYYQYTYAANKLNGIATTSSNAYSPTWTYNYLNGGTNSGTSALDAYDVLKRHGALTLKDMPYTGTTTGYNYSWSNNTSAMMNALKTRVSYSDEVTISAEKTAIASNADAVLKNAKKLLSTGNVLLVRVQANTGLTNWSFKNRYGSSEYVAYRASSASGGHALTVVGYNDNVCCDVNGNGTIEASERGAFKIANSWGTGWKNKGYVWVLYDALNKVSANKTNNWESSESGTRISIFARGDADKNNVFHYIEVENYDVNMAGLLNVTTNNRNKLSVNLFRNADNSTSYTNSISYLTIHKNMAGEVEFNGSIVFDYGEYDDPVNVCTNGYYFGINIDNWSSSNTTALTNVSYKIIDNEFNVIKQISSLPTTIANNSNARGSVMVSCKKGDVDYDGSITTTDSTIVMNYCAEISSLSNLQRYLADFNNDGVVNVSDVVSINLYINSHSSSSSELQKVQEINERVIQIMEDSGYSQAEIDEVQQMNTEIQQQIQTIETNYETE